MKKILILQLLILFIMGCKTTIETHYLTVNVTPNYSSVYVDDDYKGTTPLEKLEVSPGNYVLRVEHNDFHSFESNISILDDIEETIIEKNLRKYTGKLILEDFPSNLDIVLEYSDILRIGSKIEHLGGESSIIATTPINYIDIPINTPLNIYILLDGVAILQERLKFRNKDEVQTLSLEKIDLLKMDFIDYYTTYNPSNLDKYLNEYLKAIMIPRAYKDLIILFQNNNDKYNIEQVENILSREELKVTYLEVIYHFLSEGDSAMLRNYLQRYSDFGFQLDNIFLINDNFSNKCIDIISEYGVSIISISDLMNSEMRNGNYNFLFHYASNESHRNTEFDYYKYNFSNNMIEDGISLHNYNLFQISDNGQFVLFANDTELIKFSETTIEHISWPGYENTHGIDIDNNGNIYLIVKEGEKLLLSLLRNHSITKLYEIPYSFAFLTNVFENGSIVYGVITDDDLVKYYRYLIHNQTQNPMLIDEGNSRYSFEIDNKIYFSISKNIFKESNIEDSSSRIIITHIDDLNISPGFDYALYNKYENEECISYVYDYKNDAIQEIFKSSFDYPVSFDGWILSDTMMQIQKYFTR